MDRVPYTYYLFHVPTGKRYYGVRYARACHPDDLWKTYFTSSKIVKSLIQSYGVDSFLHEVRRTFTSKDKALDWEHRFLKRVGAAHSSEWINQTDSRAIPAELAKTKPDGFGDKIRKAKLGVPRSDETKRKISLSRKGKKYGPRSQETKNRQSAALKGRVFTPEWKAKISASKKRCKLDKVMSIDTVSPE